MDLINDKFSTDLTAGNVNGSSCEEGPGTRVVTGNTAKVSIVSNKLKIVGDADNATGITINPSFLRIPGRVLKHKFTLNSIDGAKTAFIGCAINQSGDYSGYSNVGCQLMNTVCIGARNTGTSYINPFYKSIALATEYTIYQVLRNNGQFVLLKDSNGIISLRHVDTWNNTSILYFSASINTDSSASEILIDDVYLNDKSFVIRPQVSDSFNRADGNIGTTDGYGSLEYNGGAGYSWTNRVGVFAISSISAKPSNVTGDVAIATVGDISPDQIVGCKITQSSGNVGIVVRYVDENNYVRAYYDGTNVKLEKVVSGVATQIGASLSSALKVNGTLRVLVDGTTIMAYYDGIGLSALTMYDLTDSIFRRATKFGIYSTSVDNSIKDFYCFNVYGYRGIDGATVRGKRYVGMGMGIIF